MFSQEIDKQVSGKFNPWLLCIEKIWLEWENPPCGVQ